MQFNYHFLKFLTKELSDCLINKRLALVFTQNKNELILKFDRSVSDFFIKANLDSEASLLSFPTSFARAKKNSVDLFGEIIGMKVIHIRQFKNERSFSIQFENQYELLFKLHGRHSNIILFKNDELLTLFKNNIAKDQLLDLKGMDREIDQSDEAIVANNFDVFKTFPTFDKHIKGYLKSNQFYDLESADAKLEILHDLLGQLNDHQFYVSVEVPDLYLLKPEGEYESFSNPITASNFLARQFFTNHGFAQAKNKLLTQLNKEIKKSESYIMQNENKRKEIKNSRGYDEIANILMANLHLKVNPMSKDIELFDFYSNEQIKIKLKPNQSLQQNAENLYRKAKNQSKEIDILNENISAKKKMLESLKTKVATITSLEDIKELRVFDKPPSSSIAKEASPFMEFEIEGFQVFAGKNAKNNDLLTQKFARKDDLWLHARDVSGSHVIIRTPKGVKIPMRVIEQVARLAAWHSKRKSDTLCPVIYTQKKYVRKPKGSLPGQVLLSKEEVILVEPKRNIN